MDLGVWAGPVVAGAIVVPGRAAPSPLTVRALIDTGADRTAIHPRVLTLVNSLPAGTIRLRRPGSSTAFKRVNLHDVRLAFGGVGASPGQVAWFNIEAAAVMPADPHLMALIGRDVLAHCRFVYDGPGSEFTPVD
jgi:predicted aspartyl protease